MCSTRIYHTKECTSIKGVNKVYTMPGLLLNGQIQHRHRNHFNLGGLNSSGHGTHSCYYYYYYARLKILRGYSPLSPPVLMHMYGIVKSKSAVWFRKLKFLMVGESYKLSKFTSFQTGNAPYSLFCKHSLNPKNFNR